MATQVKKARLSNSIFGPGNAVTKEDSTLTGVRLPTSRQMLRAALWLVKKQMVPGKKTLRTKYKEASTVLDQLKVFYAKANIPILSDCRCCAKILELMDESDETNSSMQKRDTEHSRQIKIYEFLPRRNLWHLDQ